MPRFDFLDDFDHFKTKGITIGELSLDSLNVRDALKRIMNLLDHREKSFIGDLSIVAGLSIERTEILVKHLKSIGLIRDLTNDELLKLGWGNLSIAVKMNENVNLEQFVKDFEDNVEFGR